MLAPLGGPARAQGAPLIASITPANQRVSELITIRGSGFGASFQPGASRITFEEPGGVTIEAGAPYVWRDDFIQVRVPPGGLVNGVPTPIPKTPLEVRVETAGGLASGPLPSASSR